MVGRRTKLVQELLIPHTYQSIFIMILKVSCSVLSDSSTRTKTSLQKDSSINVSQPFVECIA